MRTAICRRFVLGLINDALAAQTKGTVSPRPTKRRKPNSHSAKVVSGQGSGSPQRRSAQPDPPGTSKEHRNLDVGTSEDDEGQNTIIYQGSPSADSECPICGKSVPIAKINDHLDSNCKKYLSSGKIPSLSKSGQKDAWSKLLDGKRSGKEK